MSTMDMDALRKRSAVGRRRDWDERQKEREEKKRQARQYFDEVLSHHIQKSADNGSTFVTIKKLRFLEELADLLKTMGFRLDPFDYNRAYYVNWN